MQPGGVERPRHKNTGRILTITEYGLYRVCGAGLGRYRSRTTWKMENLR